MIFNYEWQTSALFAALFALALWTLYRWHTDPAFASFSLLDLIAEDGRLSSRKFMEMGSFLVASAVVVVVTIRGSITWEWVAGYCSVFVLARFGGQSVHAYTAINTRGGTADDDRESVIK